MNRTFLLPKRLARGRNSNNKMASPVIVNCDDNEGNRYARGRLLRLSGFTVHDAGMGREALNLVHTVDPDLVLLDVNLPDMSGIEVSRAIKKDPATSSIIVLQISASAVTPPQATESLNSGADSYLIDPIDPDVLVAAIRALLRLRKAEREVAQSNDALREANIQLQDLNRALRRSNDDLEHFAYIASHDLQEPLRTITTHLQLISRSLGPRLHDNEQELLGFVVDASRRMGLLIDDVLAYSRVGREASSFEEIQLQDPVSWALRNLTESIAEADAIVSVSELPSVWGDATQLSQVFQNLIGNALKYRAEGRRLLIEIHAESGKSGDWVIHVSDNGIGIDREHHERVFRPFKRLHGREIPGTGIGLALCRRIVESHGGTIWVDSTVGSGSRFSFTLRPPPDGSNA